ncbi:DNA-binding response regulator [Trinickia symbiotica]|uniref:DNA-binding response regulator n=1 Tax=Trinickia symbiotica TaxID=863227 RepID=A0A2T3XZG6_9BURK|nr:winged helix-turn-helix domain-containing protein [Trinickia symbiotica]PTB21896.1 DNA-binding response regulator [Trinickia symbiotica]
MDKIDHVLVIDDDRGIRELVGDYLEKNGMRVSLAANGREMRQVLEGGAPDLIVLDLMLPGEDGLVLCRDLRAGKHRATPFAVRELLARVRAVLRRTRMLPPGMQVTETANILAFGDWRLDTTARHLLDSEGTMVALSGAEYRLLRVFLDHPQRVLTRDQLLNLTQGRQADAFDRSIDLLVSRLRQRLRDVAREPRYIKTLRSEGYVFSAAVTAVDGPGQ